MIFSNTDIHVNYIWSFEGPVTAVDAASASDASKCNAHTRPTKWGRVKTCLRPFRISKKSFKKNSVCDHNPAVFHFVDLHVFGLFYTECLKLKSCLFGTPEVGFFE